VADREIQAMRRTRLFVALILLLIGAAWVGQGTGAVAGSAMSGQSMWAIVGGVFVVAGLALGLRELTRKPAGRP
jgi:FtsH-binding integral membrane protein